MPLIFDGHLDIAMNALRYERDQRLSVAAVREREANLEGTEPGTCSNTVASMRQAGVAACLSTVIARSRPNVALPPERRSPRYGLDHPTQDMAYASAMGQLAYYEELQRQGHITLIRTSDELQSHWRRWTDLAATDAAPPLGVIVTMEGADPIVEPEQVHDWWDRGLRTLMLAHFQQSCYAFGTPGIEDDYRDGLTDMGRALIKEMDSLSMALDLTHLCDMSFAEVVGLHDGPIYASHSNCRTLASHERQLSDDQIKLIIERDGVVGMSMHIWMIKNSPGVELPREEIGFDHVAQHIDHICQLAGSAKHVALGTDLDGGFGVEDCPYDLDNCADLHRLEDILAKRGYTSEDVAAVMHGNWLSFWSRVLPGG